MTAAEALTVDIDHLRSWIGREDLGSDVLTEDLARKYHATFDLAGEAPKFGEVAPRMIHVCLAQPAVPTAQLGPDGHPERGGFLPPVPLPRRMWAGSSQTFHDDLRVGDEVRRISRIADVVFKEGRTGALCFVTVQHQIEASGRLVLEERQDIVYRNIEASGATPKTPPPAEAGAHRRPMKIEPPLLLRYSALTFNAHRIHYDRRYSMEVEGYPALVVHGPMQAAMLLNYATELHGSPPSRFRFRGQSPLFDDAAFALNARDEGDGLKLWTARQDGPECMVAEASWQ
ncbi:MaoC family dehydratase N-terminal domain-containing protein [Bosea sp. SSUT16]|jgi:3-methylfumaryl-CoA hydratase|uniref:MaoC family dehydratase N-terminal domain-containing protein n=1 Tax=Bosea spartocytisi TaxID=2773451 RepID=A0A927I2X0_9HYPH|nr:MaoC family dehydratase N-terminal domain-containing protein [Bosea spartocytisi]MBD3848128.1 MaoC family dehydratase N-terminal domain-containing protein [Bosea spartocytisi]MCT4473978.1 MaoC family dehydratase N-terminal domain-containing protein [Bosea spartocytisi]